MSSKNEPKEKSYALCAKAIRYPLCIHCRFLKMAAIVFEEQSEPQVVYTCQRKDCDNHTAWQKRAVKRFIPIER